MRVKDIANFNPKGVKPADFINYIDTSSVEEGRLIDVQSLSKDMPSRAQRVVALNDILISSVRPNLKHNYFVDRVIEHCIASTGFIQIRVTSNNVLPRFLYYYLTEDSKVCQYQTIAETSQSTFPSFNKDVIENLDFPDISLQDQQHIVDILGSIDEQIENNNKTIDKLENLLSSKYHELIAHNTTEIPLSNCIELYTGKLDANAAEKNGKYPFFTCGITPEKINTYAFDCEAIIIAGNGNFNVKYYNGKFNAYQRTYVIKANKYFAIILQHYKGKIKEWSSSARGSVIKFLTKSMLIDDTIKISNNDAKNVEYESFSKTIQEKIKHLLETNAKQIELKQLYLKKFFG